MAVTPARPAHRWPGIARRDARPMPGPEQVAAYQRDGFLLWRRLIPAADLDPLRGRLAEAVDGLCRWRHSERWLPGTSRRQPLASVASSIAIQALTMTAGCSPK